MSEEEVSRRVLSPDMEMSVKLAYTVRGMDAEANQDVNRPVELGFDRAVLARDIQKLQKQR